MHSSYSIERAKEGDEIVLKDVLRQNGQKPTIVINEKSIYYCARSDEKTIGLAGAEINGHSALIRSVAVLAAWRNKGVAKELIDRLFSELDKKDIRHLYL